MSEGITALTKYGVFTAVQEAPREKWIDNRRTWICICECGKETLVRASVLKECKLEKCKHIKITTINPGDTINKLTVIKEDEEDETLYICLCECGKETKVKWYKLRDRKAVSCGCARKKHGMWKSLTYKRWRTMINRCNYLWEYSKNYYNKVEICNEWRNSFSAFLKDMGECPGAEYTLDRIDNNKGYEPNNCRWATVKQQARNRKNTIRVGDISALDYAETLGIDPKRFVSRLRKGYSVEDASKETKLNPAKTRQKFTKKQVLEIRDRVSHGESQTKLAKEYNVHTSTINHIVTKRNYKNLE